MDHLIQCGSCSTKFRIPEKVAKQIGTKKVSVKCERCGERIAVNGKELVREQESQAGKLGAAAEPAKAQPDKSEPKRAVVQKVVPKKAEPNKADLKKAAGIPLPSNAKLPNKATPAKGTKATGKSGDKWAITKSQTLRSADTVGAAAKVAAKTAGTKTPGPERGAKTGSSDKTPAAKAQPKQKRSADQTLASVGQKKKSASSDKLAAAGRSKQAKLSDKLGPAQAKRAKGNDKLAGGKPAAAAKIQPQRAVELAPKAQPPRVGAAPKPAAEPAAAPVAAAPAARPPRLAQRTLMGVMPEQMKPGQGPNKFASTIAAHPPPPNGPAGPHVSPPATQRGMPPALGAAPATRRGMPPAPVGNTTQHGMPAMAPPMMPPYPMMDEAEDLSLAAESVLPDEDSQLMMMEPIKDAKVPTDAFASTMMQGSPVVGFPPSSDRPEPSFTELSSADLLARGDSVVEPNPDGVPAILEPSRAEDATSGVTTTSDTTPAPPLETSATGAAEAPAAAPSEQATSSDGALGTTTDSASPEPMTSVIPLPMKKNSGLKWLAIAASVIAVVGGGTAVARLMTGHESAAADGDGVTVAFNDQGKNEAKAGTAEPATPEAAKGSDEAKAEKANAADDDKAKIEEAKAEEAAPEEAAQEEKAADEEAKAPDEPAPEENEAEEPAAEDKTADTTLSGDLNTDYDGFRFPKQLPPQVTPVGLVALTGKAMRRAERCNPGGHATGSAKVLIKFGQDGHPEDVKVVGEPIASAPVASCIVIHGQSVILPRLTGDPFTVEADITLK